MAGLPGLGEDFAAGKLRPIVGAPWRFARNPAKLPCGAPLLGERNACVYCELLGLDSRNLAARLKDGTTE